MAFLINEDTHYLIQGITGKEGRRVLNWMAKAGARVVAGVTPGKGGQAVDDIPVFDSVAGALSKFPQINFASVYVPPNFVLEAAQEAIRAKIPQIHIIAEGVPTKDSAKIIEQAREVGVRVIGPSSIGIVSPRKSAVGSLSGALVTGGGTGFSEELQEASGLISFGQMLSPGEQGGVAVISKSGGMANTTAGMLTKAGIPQTTVVGIGGDRLIGTTFADLLPEIEADDETKASVIIGEFGGSYEEDLAEALLARRHEFKPIIAFIAGIFAETLPQGVAFGHAGAIVSKTTGTRQGKISALEQAGVVIAKTPTEIPHLIKEKLGW